MSQVRIKSVFHNTSKGIVKKSAKWDKEANWATEAFALATKRSSWVAPGQVVDARI